MTANKYDHLNTGRVRQSQIREVKPGNIVYTGWPLNMGKVVSVVETDGIFTLTLDNGFKASSWKNETYYHNNRVAVVVDAQGYPVKDE